MADESEIVTGEVADNVVDAEGDEVSSAPDTLPANEPEAEEGVAEGPETEALAQPDEVEKQEDPGLEPSEKTVDDKLDIGAETNPVALSERTKSGTGVGDLVVVGIFALILGVLLALPTALGLIGGESKEPTSVASVADSSIAAVVNGTPINEGDVTDYIMKFRSQQGLEDDKDWGEWMVNFGYTADSLRSDTIDMLVDRELIKQAVAEQGVEVDESKVDDFIASVTEQVGGEETFKEALEAEGIDIEEYRSEIRLSLQQQALAEKVVTEDIKVDDKEILETVKMYYPDSVDENAKSLKNVDAELVDEIRTQLESEARQQAFYDWMDSFREKAAIEIGKIPEGLPYAIDLTPYKTAVESQSQSEGVGDVEIIEDDAESSDDAVEEGDIEIVEVEDTDDEASGTSASAQAK